jgi:hypothetical protein
MSGPTVAAPRAEHRDHLPHGTDTVRSDSGEVFSGIRSPGCFRGDGGRMAAVGRPLAKSR